MLMPATISSVWRVIDINGGYSFTVTVIPVSSGGLEGMPNKEGHTIPLNERFKVVWLG